ncbi:Agc/rsk/rsk-unclassified protein kinase, partial [Globisporangium splendens]
MSSSLRFKSSRRRGNSQEANYGSTAHNGSGMLGSSPGGGYSRNTISAAPGKGFHAGFGGSGNNLSSSGGPHSHSPSSYKEEGGSGAFVSSKTGFLTKRAMSSMDAFANWKERFFVLAEGHLSYYKQGGGFFNSGKEDIAHLKGELELTSDSIVRKSNIDDKANCFEVVTPTKKMFAQASTAKEMEDWVKCIRAHINALKRPQGRGSFHDASPPFSAAPASGMEDYSRPSMLEDHEIVRGANMSSDPKDMVIKQLLEENRQLREQLTMKDQIIHELEMNGGRSVDAPSAPGGGKIRQSAPQMILDLRDVKKKQFQLFDAAEIGNWHLIATLLRDNVVDVNGVGINQTTALHLAAKNNHPNAVKELLARSAEPSARNGDSYTPLHLAVQEGNVACVEELLNAGADPNATDYQGNGAIHMAAEGGNIAIAKLLVAKGARIDAPNASGSLPVHLSPIGHPIRVLLGSGSNLAATNPSQPPKPRGEVHENNDTQVSHLAFKNKYQKDLALGPRDFEFVKVLGRGAFAKVYLVRGKGSNRDKWYALKAYNKQAIVQKNQAQYIHTEKAALQACSDHPYIVTLYYAFQSQDRLFLVMEYCGGGDLLSALTRRKVFTEPEAAFYIGEIALALSHLHSKNIVFRDLKPENVVMDLEGHCLLTDFGISKEGIKDHTSANTFCGSPMYLAPEMLSRSGHGFALDWYSVGALLFELLTGLPPFYTNDKKQLFHNILRGHLVIPDHLSPNARDLIQRLLHRDPKQRLGSGPTGDREIFTHPFFSTVDWDKLKRRELAPPFRPKITTDPTGVPDTSNFPQAFTDQEISDIERGFELMDPNAQQIQRPGNSQKDDRRLFKDFDFTPELQLDSEAKQFEQLALQQNSFKNLPAPALLEADEYSI